MRDRLIRMLGWYDKKCCSSQKIRKLTEFIFWLLRVEPHDAKLRDGTDRFYLVMVLFSAVYMGLLSAALFFKAMPKELEYYLTSETVSVFYIVLAVIYTIAKEVQKRISSVNKKRGGQFIVYIWTGLAIAFTLLVVLTERVTYLVTDPALETIWFVAIISQAHVWGSRLTREPIMNGVEKMINGRNHNSQGTAK